MDDTELRQLALKRLKKKADFRSFLWVWLGVSVLLTLIYLLTNPGGYFWPAWAIGGMGVAAFFSWVDAYGFGRQDITEDQITAEAERIQRRR